MKERIAIIDFPPSGKETSWFAVNDAARHGDGGLVGCVREHGFEPHLLRCDNLPELDPKDFAAVFYASGYTEIRHPEKRKEKPDTKEINPDLESAVKLYDNCLTENIPVVAFTHGSQILVFYTGGEYFKLPDGKSRRDSFIGYVLANPEMKDHWLMTSPNNIRIIGLAAREYRDYGVNLKGSQFKALILPGTYYQSGGPAVAVHKDPSKFAVLFFMHPEYDKMRYKSAYRLMENIFAKIKTLDR